MIGVMLFILFGAIIFSMSMAGAVMTSGAKAPQKRPLRGYNPNPAPNTSPPPPPPPPPPGKVRKGI